MSGPLFWLCYGVACAVDALAWAPRKVAAALERARVYRELRRERDARPVWRGPFE